MTSKQTFAEIKLAYEKAQALDAKNHYKAIKVIAHTVYQNYQSTASLEEMDLYIKIIRETIRLHGNKYSRFLSKIIGDWLNTTGNSNANILKKVSSKIVSHQSVDSGSCIIAVGNPSWFKANAKNVVSNWSATEILNFINKGEIFIFESEPIEEFINIQIRIVDSPEPVLTAKEFKNVISSSETAIIHLSENFILATDLQELDISDNEVTAPITPGNYKIAVYHFQIPKKLQSFYVVLCKTDNEASNNLLHVTRFLDAR